MALGCTDIRLWCLLGRFDRKQRETFFAAKRKFQNEVDCGSTNFLKILESVTLEGVRCNSGAVKVYQWHTKSVDRWVCLKIPLDPLVNHLILTVNNSKHVYLGIFAFSDNPVDHIRLTDFGAGAAERIRVLAQKGWAKISKGP